jgi:hypothetical protein
MKKMKHKQTMSRIGSKQIDCFLVNVLQQILARKKKNKTTKNPPERCTPSHETTSSALAGEVKNMKCPLRRFYWTAQSARLALEDFQSPGGPGTDNSSAKSTGKTQSK